MTRKMINIKKKPPETPYTIAEVREMETVLSVMITTEAWNKMRKCVNQLITMTEPAKLKETFDI